VADLQTVTEEAIGRGGSASSSYTMKLVVEPSGALGWRRCSSGAVVAKGKRVGVIPAPAATVAVRPMSALLEGRLP